MSATSQKLNRLCKRIVTALALPAVIATFGTVSAFANVSGAIFTTTSDGSIVNKNIYELCSDVYLNGGPQNGHCDDPSAGLPDGHYYFQVTTPSGQNLLSTDAITNRKVTVSGGLIVSTSGTHLTGTGQCPLAITVQLLPFDPTPNPGGEYKVWMTPVDSYGLNGTDVDHNFGFDDSATKTDNFKCRDRLVECDTGKFVCISCRATDLQVPCTHLNATEVVVTYDPPTVTGAADPSVICTPASGSSFPAGQTTTVNCSVTD